MPVLDMYNEFRNTFPEATKLADREHIRTWDEIDPEFAFSWFESLANAINAEMKRKVDVKHYKEVFEFLRKQYMLGDEEIKNCIDVAFTENLFWRVPSNETKLYWSELPDVLKQLYISFHGHPPA